MNDKSKKLAEDHWSYIKSLLSIHKINQLETIEFHYKSAFIHGFKHGVEEVQNNG